MSTSKLISLYSGETGKCLLYVYSNKIEKVKYFEIFEETLYNLLFSVRNSQIENFSNGCSGLLWFFYNLENQKIVDKAFIKNLNINILEIQKTSIFLLESVKFHKVVPLN